MVCRPTFDQRRSVKRDPQLVDRCVAADAGVGMLSSQRTARSR